MSDKQLANLMDLFTKFSEVLDEIWDNNSLNSLSLYKREKENRVDNGQQLSWTSQFDNVLTQTKLAQQCNQLNLLNTLEDCFEFKRQIPNINLIDIKESIENEKKQLLKHRKRYLFHRHVTLQKKKIQQSKNNAISRMKILEENYDVGELLLSNRKGDKAQKLSFLKQDWDSLRAGLLSETIINNYLKFLQISGEIGANIYIFPSHLIERIGGQYMKIGCQKPKYTQESVRQKIKQNYEAVKRLTNRIDIFNCRKILFPIFGYGHWFCVIIQFGKEGAHMLYCDSMHEKKSIIIQIVRCYLECEYKEKKSNVIQFNDKNMPCYQLLLPRQTQPFQCGVYALLYAEHLLSNSNRTVIYPLTLHLNMFPRNLAFTFRERVKRLFTYLIRSKSGLEKIILIDKFWQQKRRLIKEATCVDYDEINPQQIKKYDHLYHLGEKGDNKRTLYVRFYLDWQCNHYEELTDT